MKKRILSTILVVIMALLCLAACSQSANTPVTKDPEAAPSSGTSSGADKLSGTVTFLSGETDEEQVTVHKKIIEEFEAIHPDVKVDLVLSGFDDREEKILADLYAGAPVDIIQIDSETIGAYAKAGILLPLDDLISSIGEDDFMDGSRIIVDNHDYGMPYAGCSMMMYVRDDLFKDAGLEYPKTWDDLLNCAEKLTVGDQYGLVLPAGQNNATALWLQMFINMAGGNVFNEKLEPTLDTKEVVEALTFYRDLAKYCPAGITSYGYGEQISAFCSGQVAMTIYQGRVIARVANEAPEIDKKYTIIPVPTSGKLDVQFGAYTYYSIGKNCKAPDATKEFLKFLTTGEKALEVAMSAPGHITPALHSVSNLVDSYDNEFVRNHIDKIKFSFNHAASKTFNEAVNAGGVKGSSFEYNGILNTNFSSIRQYNILSNMVQRVLIENVDPETVCKEAQQELLEILKNNA